MRTSHDPGYALVYHGDDPLTGWRLEPIELAQDWEQGEGIGAGRASVVVS